MAAVPSPSSGGPSSLSPTNGKMPNPPTSSPAAIGKRPSSNSSNLSPNHPTNLRKQAKVPLDPSFSVRSYLGAAAALLEKAESSDRQGHLEQAFVNYIKAANVGAFIPKHPEWAEIVAARGPTWSRYQEFMQKTTDVISRAMRIEDTLKQREERNAAQLAASAPTSSSSASSPSLAASRVRQDGPTTAPPPPAEPGPSKQLRTDAEGGEAAAALVSSNIRSRPSNGPVDTDGGSGANTPVLSQPTRPAAEESDQVSSLADRLSALRSGGVPMRKRFSEPISPSHSLTPTRSTDEEQAAVGSSLSQFQEAYPSLDEFDQRLPSPNTLPLAQAGEEDGTQNGLFPAPPSHAPGASRRPLPTLPPAPPTELALSRDVPKPLNLGSDAPRPTSPTTSRSRASPALPAALIPGSPKTSPIASRKMMISSSSSGSIGPKPTLPKGGHIKVEELWSLLNPGFEQVTDEDGRDPRLVRKQGLQILLLDLRSRDDFEMGRVGAGSAAEVVCLDGSVTLRRGMTSSDIEDKLLLAPPVEQNAFASRHKYDAVVIYDRASRSLGQPHASTYNPSVSGWPTFEEAARAWDNVDIVFKAIYEQEFTKNLKTAPLLLIGGWESWRTKVGDKAALASTGAPLVNGRGDRSGSVSRRQQEDDLVKRQRRQGVVIPDNRAALPPQYRSPSPPSGGFAGGLGSSGLSMPAKAYQSPALSSGGMAAPAGAPGFPPSSASGRSNGYFPNQPTIPYGVSSHPPSHASAGFDYPQLRTSASGPIAAPSSSASGHPKLPAATMNSNGVSSRAMTSHAHNQSITSTRSLDSNRRPSVGGGLSQAGSRMNIKMLPAFDDLRIGLTGLKNVGNSCYQNSTLQCLSATIPLAKFMLDGSYKQAINKVNPLGTQGALAESFAHLIKVMWSEQYTFVSPVTFRDAISKFAPAFKGYDQHDSQEFLAFLLDGLHEDLNYVVHKPPPVEMTPDREEELETLPQQVASVKEWTIYRQRNDSLIVDWFQGQFRNKMTCLTCGKTSTTYNAFMYLSLPVPAGRGINKVTLFQCLDAFVKEEVMEKQDAWHCPRCQKPRKATKQLSISRLPMILLIHLKRFSFRGGPFTDKIETQVTFPIQGLDLTNYVPPPLSPALQKSFISQGVTLSRSQTPPYIYDLYGVGHHFGSLTTGHYTASIKSAGQWFYCDDSRTVGPPSNGGLAEGEKRIMSNSPYVLWFRRRP